MQLLLVEQEKRLAPRLARISLGRNPPAAPKPPSTSSTSTDHSLRNDRRPPNRQRSYERTRPPHLSPQAPLSPSSASFSDFPPSAPEVPSSPLGSTSATGTSQSTHSDVIQYHWIKDIFTTFDTRTPLPPGRERCERPQVTVSLVIQFTILTILTWQSGLLRRSSRWGQAMASGAGI